MTAIAPAPRVRPALVELLPRGNLRAALGFAWRSLRASAYLCASVPGVHVFTLVGRELVVRFLGVGPEEHLVLGDDRTCDIRVPGLAPRQLLLTSMRLPDGVTAVRLLDIGHGRGVRVGDGRATRSLVASGPFAVSVGGHVVGALPFDAARYARDPQRGPVAPLIENTSHLPSSCIPGTRGRRPRITCLPGPRAITDVVHARYTGVARVSVARGRHEASIQLDEKTLSRGVLVGRARSAAEPRWRRVLGSNVSRTHLLLLREHGRALAYDLRSERGTFAAGIPVRGARLSGQAELTLGRVDPATLKVATSRSATEFQTG